MMQKWHFSYLNLTKPLNGHSRGSGNPEIITEETKTRTVDNVHPT